MKHNEDIELEISAGFFKCVRSYLEMKQKPTYGWYAKDEVPIPQFVSDQEVFLGETKSYD